MFLGWVRPCQSSSKPVHLVIEPNIQSWVQLIGLKVGLGSNLFEKCCPLVLICWAYVRTIDADLGGIDRKWKINAIPVFTTASMLSRCNICLANDIGCIWNTLNSAINWWGHCYACRGNGLQVPSKTAMVIYCGCRFCDQALLSLRCSLVVTSMNGMHRNLCSKRPGHM